MLCYNIKVPRATNACSHIHTSSAVLFSLKYSKVAWTVSGVNNIELHRLFAFEGRGASMGRLTISDKIHPNPAQPAKP